MQWFLDNIGLAVFVGIFSNGLFLLLLHSLRPRVLISGGIAKGTSTKNGKTIYRFKIINQTRFDLTDIRAELHIRKTHTTPSGSIIKTTQLPLRQSHPLVIKKFRPYSITAGYAYRLLTYAALEDEWDDYKGDSLRIRLFARNAFSGTGKVFEQVYRDKSAIVMGEFKKGYSFKIEGPENVPDSV